ncbi:RNA polymerase sigma factor [Neorhodopirellula pilleata]|uniref:ECF RNA polymerase sigma factor SigE n=1 Tax=Neorhodopirellula pilleata TaxID=2714738 RepID=A0A5C6A6L6_9BACT|nr:sigma-70 family RNA polymerase sigma factor [Neorhodopirellula pilleata]TWT95025.1 ECF RNA polymerase sigma factor SigE [Neorhodopirellula pilleata]
MSEFEPPPQSPQARSPMAANPARSEFQNAVAIRAENLARLGEDAICGLIDLTSQRLVRFATTITRNQHDAEDAVQTTLIQVARQPKLLAGCDDPWAYLLRMVRNESLLIGRRKPRWRLIDGLCDLLTHRRVDEIELEERYREVWLALRKLPMQQSEVVVLKIWEDMTFADIANVLEITPSTAASRYRYAKQKLAQLLASHETESSGVGHHE